MREIDEKDTFFNRFNRIHTLDLRKGGFSLVVPIQDKDGERYALKHFKLKAGRREEPGKNLESLRARSEIPDAVFAPDHYSMRKTTWQGDPVTGVG